MSVVLRRSPRAILLGLTALTFPAYAFGQEDSANPVVQLDQVVITAGGFEQNVENAPASVTVISGEELAKGDIRSLSDALKGVQGVVTTGIANEEDISIRGMPGGYTLILVDGKRQGTRESRTNGSAGFEQSFMPPVAAIDRIEVVRGPMSSLYGSDAMGGVVNIITKSVSDTWSGELSAEATVPQDDKYSSTRQYTAYLNGPIVKDVLGLQVWGRLLDRSEAHVDDGLFGRDLQSYGGRLTYQVNADHKFMLEGNRTEIDDEGHIGRALPPVGPTGRPNTDSSQHNERSFVALSYNGTWGTTTADISVSREEGKRKFGTPGVSAITAAREPKITNDVIDVKFNTPLNWRGEHRLTYGGQYFNAKLHDINPGLSATEYHTYSAWQRAIFAEDEWQISDSFALTVGARYNDHEEFGSHVTPRIYGVWQANENLTIKGGVSTGYRAPEVRQVVNGYYYTTERGAGVIVSNPNLKPEESTSVELGALYHGEGYEVGATAFYTDFKNKIESYKTDDQVTIDGQTFNRWNYRNVGKARIQGIELTGQWDINDSLLVRANYTYTDSKQRTGEYKDLPLMRTPKHMASLRGEYIPPVEGLDAWAQANYHGKEINAGARIGTNGKPYRNGPDGRPIAFEYDDYLTFDIGANYKVNEHAKISGAIYNLFDKELSPSDANTVIEGRAFWLGVTTTF